MKKILFLTYDFPYPFNSGGKIRAFNLMKYGGKGFDVQLFSFTRGEVSSRQMKKLMDIGVSNIYLHKRNAPHILNKMRSIASSQSSIFKKLYYSPLVEEKIVEIIQKENIDIVHCESFYTSFYINSKVIQTGVRTVFGTENIEYKIYDEYVKNSVPRVLKKLYQREVGKIKAEEIKALEGSDVTIAVSQEEADIFNSLTHEDSVIVENGIDTQFFSYYPKKKDAVFNILFVGNFKYFPNVEAAKFLYEKIYKALPKSNTELTIVGKNVEKLPIPMQRGIKLVDYVEDIRDVYKAADVLVSPVTMGGGTSFKTLEAMAMGVPIIAHEVRMKPLGAVADQHYLSAQAPEEFLKQVSFIQENPKKINMMTKQARLFVEKNYSWEVIGKKLQAVWKSL